ncbi:MAG: sulfotransferase family protein [Longimicrobiales bacterium]
MIESPIIVLGVPRSGTTLVQRCLSLHPDLWSLPAESHRILEGPFHPARSGYESNRVTADALTEPLAAQLRARFFSSAINLNRVVRDPSPLSSAGSVTGRALTRAAVLALGATSRLRKPGRIRFLEKTPKNVLRIPMLAALFPDARFLWLRRDPVANIASLVRGWYSIDRVGPFRRERFATYPIAGALELHDYASEWWKFALVPGWRSLHGTTVADVAVRQYRECERHARIDLGGLDEKRVFCLRFEDLLGRRDDAIRDILRWAGLARSETVEDFARRLPAVNRTGAIHGLAARDDGVERRVAAALERCPLASDPDARPRHDAAIVGS